MNSIRRGHHSTPAATLPDCYYWYYADACVRACEITRKRERHYVTAIKRNKIEAHTHWIYNICCIRSHETKLEDFIIFFSVCCGRLYPLYTVLTRIHRVIIGRIPIVSFLPYLFPLYIILLYFLSHSLTLTATVTSDHMRALWILRLYFWPSQLWI